jgi:hypothetical protein
MMGTLSLDMNVESDTLITNISHANFVGITIENILYWKSHMDQLLCKLSAACFSVSSQNVYNSRNLVMVYYAYFHLLMNYGIIVCGNSPYSINIFRIQKEAIGIITSTRNRESDRDV